MGKNRQILWLCAIFLIGSVLGYWVIFPDFRHFPPEKIFIRISIAQNRPRIKKRSENNEKKFFYKTLDTGAIFTIIYSEQGKRTEPSTNNQKKGLKK